jgi:hypothetical protein
LLASSSYFVVLFLFPIFFSYLRLFLLSFLVCLFRTYFILQLFFSFSYPLVSLRCRSRSSSCCRYWYFFLFSYVFLFLLLDRLVLGGPANLTRGGIIPLVATTGAGEVLQFIKNWRTPNEDIGRVLRIVYAWCQYQARVSFPLLEQPEESITYLQGKVIPSLREYLSKIDGKLKLDKTYIRKKLRANNIAIMDIVRQVGFTEVQEHQINCVRLFLGVMYFSKICSIDGTTIRDGITTGHNNNEEYILT